MNGTRGFFITGTNTEVGKTVITRALARSFARRGLKVAALKPVESRDDRGPSDAALLRTAAKMDPDRDDNCAYSFSRPLSPHLAALRENRAIRREVILELVTRWRESAEVLLVEGAGGLLAPLSEELLYADLMSEIGLPLIIVAPDVLGSINATLLTVEAARSRGLRIVGVILNLRATTELDNAAAIARHGGITILGKFPNAPVEADDDSLAELAEKHLDLNCLDNR